MRLKDEITRDIEDICLEDKTVFDIIKPYIEKAIFMGISEEQLEAASKLLSK